MKLSRKRRTLSVTSERVSLLVRSLVLSSVGLYTQSVRRLRAANSVFTVALAAHSPVSFSRALDQTRHDVPTKKMARSGSCLTASTSTKSYTGHHHTDRELELLLGVLILLPPPPLTFTQQ